MLSAKSLTLKPLLESSEGVHLTAYLVNRGTLIGLKVQLKETINRAYEHLSFAMSTEERTRFLEPLDSLLSDVRILKKMKGNIGIFRSFSTFRVLNVPVDVEQTFQIATSFHVKPLLRWMQTDQEFLLLGLDKDSAHLYFGDQDSVRLVDSILFPNLSREKDSLGDYRSLKRSRLRQHENSQTFFWLNEWIVQLTKSSKPRLFMAGEADLIEGMNRKLEYPQAIRTPVALSFRRAGVGEICANIRRVLKEDSRRTFEKALMEFKFAERDHRVEKNIFQISKAVVQGRVTKLIVTGDLNIFGKIDRRSGQLSIHPFDLDHEDDDVLDDLAQMVLSQGGEVIVANRNEIPKGRPILAILDEGGIHDSNQVQKFR